MDRLVLVLWEMPAWVGDHIRDLRAVAELYTRMGRELEDEDPSRALEAFKNAYRLGMDIVALEREWSTSG